MIAITSLEISTPTSKPKCTKGNIWWNERLNTARRIVHRTIEQESELKRNETQSREEKDEY